MEWPVLDMGSKRFPNGSESLGVPNEMATLVFSERSECWRVPNLMANFGCGV